MLDDLGSLSEQGMAPESPVRGAERWKWLRPWAWVSGLAWKQGASKAPLVELMLHIHGSGLETCRSVQVCPKANHFAGNPAHAPACTNPL